jgi:acetyl esterase/lipase
MSLKSLVMAIGLALQTAVIVAPASAAEPATQPELVRIWPGAAPGTADWTGAETDTPLKIPGAPLLHMISNVTVPTLTVVRPSPGTANGTAIIVCPGGGFQNLAITHEGDLVARWLADRGITAFILKYRVRPSSASLRFPTDARHHPEQFEELAKSFEAGRQIAIADGIQAMRYLRANASRFAVAPNRIGMMGFSAGAVTTMGVVLDGEPADRPNFAAPIYGTMEDRPPPKDGPPLFIAATQDDNTVPVAKSVAIFSSWTAADLPAELHIYAHGGHGFGMIKHNKPVDEWPAAFEAWLRADGWMSTARTP